MSSVLNPKVPFESSPNLIIADRFEAWHQIIKHLSTHFRSVSDAEAVHNKALEKIANAVPNPFSTHEHFADSGPVPGLGQLLAEQSSGRVSHSNQIIDAIDNQVIPELDNADKVLADKIKEITSMTKDFKNDLGNGLEQSRTSLLSLQESITDWEAHAGSVPVENDPFLVDLTTRKHLRSSLGEEQYLHETMINLQQSAQQLESNTIAAIRRALAQYNDCVSEEAASLAMMSQKIEDSILAGRLDGEWKSFMTSEVHRGNLIEMDSRPRTLEDLTYSGKEHISTSPICDGWLERKSGLLASYSAAFYIISPSRYLHEFKSNDLRTDHKPISSIYLPDCELGKMSQTSDTNHKFVLRGKEAGPGLHSEHKFTFRAKTRSELEHWYTTIDRASDIGFTFTSAPSPTQRQTRAAVLELDDDEADTVPFKGPESFSGAGADVQTRPAAGRFDSTTGFDSPLAAVSAGLEAKPVGSLRRSDSTRKATTMYGVAGTSMTSPSTYAEHDEHIRQAHDHSSANAFLQKEMLDSNAELEYDREHGSHSTLIGDEDFRPEGSDATVSRSSSMNGGIRPRRQSSLAFKELPGSPISGSASPARRPRPAGKTPSRKATATYGELNSLPLPSTIEEITTPQPQDEPYQSPYFPAPGAGTTGALPASHFNQVDSVSILAPQRSSTLHSGANTPISGGRREPQRKMSLSDQIMASSVIASGPQASSASLVSQHSAEGVHADLEPNNLIATGAHSDATSPYPATQRFNIPRSRQGSILAQSGDTTIESLETYDVAPHMRIGTQTNEARYKVGSRRGSRSASGVATPLEGSAFGHSALASLSSENLAVKLNQPSSGEKARARTPSRGASINLDDGTASPQPAFNVNQKHAFRKPPSRGSSLSLGGTSTPTDGHNLLNTISETFERDLAAAKGNQPGDAHIPGEFPPTPGPNTSKVLEQP